MIVHLGTSQDSGHYVALVRRESTGAPWWLYNDDERRQATPGEVACRDRFHEEAMKVYVLFYECQTAESENASAQSPISEDRDAARNVSNTDAEPSLPSPVTMPQSFSPSPVPSHDRDTRGDDVANDQAPKTGDASSHQSHRDWAVSYTHLTLPTNREV